jgi:hypothetical protein
VSKHRAPKRPQNYAAWLFRESWSIEPPAAALRSIVQICGAFAQDDEAHCSVLNYVIVGYIQHVGDRATVDGLLSRIGAYLPGTYKSQLADLQRHQLWGAHP